MNESALNLAVLSDTQIATIALNVGEATFHALYVSGVTAGPNGPDALHMRVGTVVDGLFVQWGERTVGDGEAFAVNTVGKANTAAAYRMNSDDAFAQYGEAIPEGPGRWTGGVYVSVSTKLDNDSRTSLDPNVAACSGVQGELDRVVSAAIGNTAASLVSLREKERTITDRS
ncbi:MAG TPA: hypothetical protein VLG36_02615 [Candidatus Chromulinivoraceae bacterium]|nr:hypothetical protein [Candidatus Chromulinivoraceae bacterium]